MVGITQGYGTHTSSSSWLHQSETSISSSETNSVGSLESDVTDDEFAEADIPLCREDSDIDTILSRHGAVALDFTALFMQVLLRNDIPLDTVIQLCTIFAPLVASWMSTLATSQSAAGGGTPPLTSDFSEAGSTQTHTQPSNGGQKRTLGDDDKESPDQDDDNNRRKRQKLYGGIDAGSRQKWACPYYQREPHRYCVETEFGDFRKCARSPGFDQVHRVKSECYVASTWSLANKLLGTIFISAIPRTTVTDAMLPSREKMILRTIDGCLLPVT